MLFPGFLVLNVSMPCKRHCQTPKNSLFSFETKWFPLLLCLKLKSVKTIPYQLLFVFILTFGQQCGEQSPFTLPSHGFFHFQKSDLHPTTYGEETFSTPPADSCELFYPEMNLFTARVSSSDTAGVILLVTRHKSCCLLTSIFVQAF